MKKLMQSCCIAVSTMAIAVSVQAHDPAEHMKDAEKPDCAAMKNMDHSKMDMNDPVMQAMMKKCMASQHEGQGAMAEKMKEKSEGNMMNTEQSKEKDCSAMKKMGHSQKDLKDPEMKKMMEKCHPKKNKKLMETPKKSDQEEHAH